MPDAAPESFAEGTRSLPLFLPTRPLPGVQQSGSIPSQLVKAQFVYIRRGGAAPPLSPAYSGPFRVLSKAPKSFVIDVGVRKDEISVDRLKPHMGQAPVQPAAAPRRGRPRLSAPTGTGSSLGPG